MSLTHFTGNYTHITAATTTIVQAKAGLLHCITFNQMATSGTVIAYDSPTGTSLVVIGSIAFPATLLNNPPMTAFYDVQFNNGLTIVTTGASDITVAWR